MQWADEGPDPARDGMVRWRRADLVKWIKAVSDIDLQDYPVDDVGRGPILQQGHELTAVDPGAKAALDLHRDA